MVHNSPIAQRQTRIAEAVALLAFADHSLKCTTTQFANLLDDRQRLARIISEKEEELQLRKAENRQCIAKIQSLEQQLEKAQTANARFDELQALHKEMLSTHSSELKSMQMKYEYAEKDADAKMKRLAESILMLQKEQEITKKEHELAKQKWMNQLSQQEAVESQCMGQIKELRSAIEKQKEYFEDELRSAELRHFRKTESLIREHEDEVSTLKGELAALEDRSQQELSKLHESSQALLAAEKGKCDALREEIERLRKSTDSQSLAAAQNAEAKAVEEVHRVLLEREDMVAEMQRLQLLSESAAAEKAEMEKEMHLLRCRVAEEIEVPATAKEEEERKRRESIERRQIADEVNAAKQKELEEAKGKLQLQLAQEKSRFEQQLTEAEEELESTLSRLQSALESKKASEVRIDELTSILLMQKVKMDDMENQVLMANQQLERCELERGSLEGRLYALEEKLRVMAASRASP